MLNYASKPQSDWGPAKKENRYDRYELIENGKQSTTENDQTYINKAFDSQYDATSRL
jgi:hypothetical protein